MKNTLFCVLYAFVFHRTFANGKTNKNDYYKNSNSTRNEGSDEPYL